MPDTPPPAGAPDPAPESPPENLFLAANAVPKRKNQMMAAGLAVVAVCILTVVVTLVLLIRYDHLPSLLSYFS